MNVRSMKYSRDGNIDCQIEHPTFGWIAFTASQHDCEEAGRELFAKLAAGEFGEIAPASAPTVEELREAFKVEREARVAQIKVTTSDGLVWDGDETSQTRMARAIASMDDGDMVLWVLADNTPVQATREQLREALRLAGLRQTELWVPEDGDAA